MRKVRVPLSYLQCWDERSHFSQYLNRWIFLNQEQLLQNQGQQQVSSFLQNVKNAEAPNKGEMQMKSYYITTEKYKRVSPEFLQILNKHVPKDVSKDDSKPAKLLQEKTPPSFVQYSWEHAHPQLAAYLRSVMEKDNILNSIYGINFYANESYDEASRRGAKSESPTEYLNLANVSFLLKLLADGQPLTAEQYQYFKNFLKAVIQLAPEEFSKYMKLLKPFGAITPAVLGLLKNFLLQMESKFDMSHMTLLVNEIEKIENFLKKLNRKRMPVNSSISFKAPIREIESSVSTIKNIRKIVRKQKPPRFLSILRSGKGLKRDGFIEPWDINLPWLGSPGKRYSQPKPKLYMGNFRYRRLTARLSGESRRSTKVIEQDSSQLSQSNLTNARKSYQRFSKTVSFSKLPKSKKMYNRKSSTR